MDINLAQATLKHWRYASAASRDFRLDFLRGYLIFAMVVDHIGEESWLHALTGGDKFVISAAEGFVLLSGLVMGMVYRKVVVREGLKSAARKALGRGGKLYLVHAVLTLGFITISGVTGAFWYHPVEDKLSFLAGVLTLRQTYYITDVLHLYALLVLLVPLALLLLARGKTALLVLGSVLLWVIYQQYPWELTGITSNVAFPAAAWQILFFAGLVIGYHRARIEAVLARVPLFVLAPLLVLPAAAMLAQHISGNTLLLTEGWIGQGYHELFYKWDVRLGRMFAAAVYLPMAYLLMTVFWRPLLAGLGWFLLPLGQNSLLAYSLQLPIVLVAGTVLGRVGLEGDNYAVNAAVQIVGVALVWMAVKAAVAAPALLTRAPWRRPASSGAGFRRGAALRRPARAPDHLLTTGMSSDVPLPDGAAGSWRMRAWAHPPSHSHPADSVDRASRLD
jgi:hypothetical protein